MREDDPQALAGAAAASRDGRTGATQCRDRERSRYAELGVAAEDRDPPGLRGLAQPSQDTTREGGVAGPDGVEHPDGARPHRRQVVEVDQLRDNLYVLRGGGGNSAAFVTSDGVVLIDTKLAGWGQPLLDKIGELTSNPVTTIINTHTHFDHVSGNVDFPATVSVVTHENTEQLMGEWNPVTGFPGDFPDVFKENNGRGLPTLTFSDRMTLGTGDDQINLHYFGRGHTGGDAWVVFPALRVMHAGDMFPGKQVQKLW